MGRRPSSNLNLPPYMRKRVRGVHTYYYFDTGDKPRKEIALGKSKHKVVTAALLVINGESA